MSKETSKALNRLVNDPLFIKIRSYAGSQAIDLGCGPDCLPGAEPYDIGQGNVQDLKPPPLRSHYKLVWSSHCLEHLDEPLYALERWWGLVEPGGYLWLLVPDFHLHEHGVWPSKNKKHKTAWSLWNSGPIHAPHYNLISVVRWLPKSELIRLSLADTDYDYTRMLDTNLDQSAGVAEVACEMVVRKLP